MANDNKDRGPKIQTPVFRVNWPNMFTPRAAEEGAKAFYSISMMFRTATAPKADPAHPIVDITPLKMAAANILTAKFGPLANGGWPKINPVFRNGVEKKDSEGFDAGVWFAGSKSKRKPGLYSPQLEDIIDPNEFYAGCYAVAMVAPYWYDVKGNKGIAWSLLSVQKVKDGEAIGGQSSREDFTAITPPSGGLTAAPSADPLGGGSVANADPLGAQPATPVAGAPVDLTAIGL